MLYWIPLIILFALLLIFLLYIWKKRIKDKEMNDQDLGMIVFVCCAVFAFLVWMGIDIPSALSGGEEIYATELPETVQLGKIVTYSITDNDELRDLKGVDWNRYEKYGNYHIRYTKFNKFVLKVEKLD